MSPAEIDPSSQTTPPIETGASSRTWRPEIADIRLVPAVAARYRAKAAGGRCAVVEPLSPDR